MSQDLTVNIKTTSDVPQAMDKAKQATVSFGKQVEDIQKKFSMAFKDIFLSFLGPIAILGTAIGYIGKLIAENQRKHAEANQAAIDETNKLISTEETYWARKRANEKKSIEDKKQAEMSREDITKDFLLNDPLGRAYLYKKQGGAAQEQLPGWLKMLGKITGSDQSAAGLLSKSQEAQLFVQTAIMERRRESPLPGESTPFKTPEGFSNVVGVGANPVIEAMNEQLEIQKQQLEELKKIASPEGGVPKDFTKDSK